MTAHGVATRLDSPRTSHDAIRWLLILPPLAVSFAILAFAKDPTAAQEPLPYIEDTATGAILTVAGVLLWSRRPGRRSGPLLILAGYLWYVGSLYTLFPAQSLVPYLSFAFRGYYDALIAFIVLAFPADRLNGRGQRIAVSGLVGLMVATTAWRLIATPPGFGTGYPPSAPASPILLVDDFGLTLNVNVWLGLAIGLILAFVAVLAVLKLARMSAGARSVSGPALIGGAAWAAVAGFSMIALFSDAVMSFQAIPWDAVWTPLQYSVRILGPIGILLSVSRLRNRSTSVVDVVAGPEGAPRGAELERALRTAFHDPSLALAYPHATGWAETDGTPVDVEDLPPARAATMVAPPGAPEVAVIHDDLLLDDPTLMRTLRAVVGLAVDNDRLQSDLRAQLNEVTASRARIAEAADAERRRVEGDLHDGAQQRLVALLISLRTIRSRLGADPDPAIASEVDAASAEARAAIAELRELAQGLDPAIVREAGLSEALRSLAKRSAVPVTLETAIDRRLPARVETTAYFVVSEALTNVAKHAAATRVLIRAAAPAETLTFSISDDGTGGADPDGHGLRGLQDRVAAVGGQLLVTSLAAHGTTIDVSIPCVS
jgi:signal transduction histidine kinase